MKQRSTKQVVERLRKKIRSMVESIIKEEGTMPSKMSFTVTNGYKSIRQMMEVVENAINNHRSGDLDIQSVWETYDNVSVMIRKKLDQIDNDIKGSR